MISVASANAPNVKALVFVDAFAPDAGESVQSEPQHYDAAVDSRLRYPLRHPTAIEQPVRQFQILRNDALCGTGGCRGAVSRYATPARTTLLNGQSAGSRGMEDNSVLVRHRGRRQGHSARHPAQVCDACQVEKIYHVPGGDHPSMIAHLEVTVDAIRDAANAVSVKRVFRSLLSIAHRLRNRGDGRSIGLAETAQ